MNKEHKGPVTALKESFDRLEADCKQHKEAYLRALADFDNYRRRVERDAEQSRRVALERLVVDLLPVMDNFDRAVLASNAMQDARCNLQDGETESVRKGMELIHRQLRETLCKHGLTEYSCLGTEFDPRKAEAISFVQTDEQKPGTVVSESCKGYSCGERVIRPAKVVVAKERSRSQKAEVRSQSAEVADGWQVAGCKTQESEGSQKQAAESQEPRPQSEAEFGEESGAEN
jgi:molecular chaperone GrpE